MIPPVDCACEIDTFAFMILRKAHHSASFAVLIPPTEFFSNSIIKLAQAVKEASDSKLTANQQIIADNKKDTLTLKHQKLEETIRKNKAAANNN